MKTKKEKIYKHATTIPTKPTKVKKIKIYRCGSRQVPKGPKPFITKRKSPALARHCLYRPTKTDGNGADRRPWNVERSKYVRQAFT